MCLTVRIIPQVNHRGYSSIAINYSWISILCPMLSRFQIIWTVVFTGWGHGRNNALTGFEIVFKLRQCVSFIRRYLWLISSLKTWREIYRIISVDLDRTADLACFSITIDKKVTRNPNKPTICIVFFHNVELQIIN